MKKLFTFFAISAIVLGMASCGDGNEPEASDFQIEVQALYDRARVVVTPPANNEKEYFWWYVNKSEINAKGSLKNYVEYKLAQDTYVAYKNLDMILIDEDVYWERGLDPAKEYVVYACFVEKEGEYAKISGGISSKEFKTMPENTLNGEFTVDANGKKVHFAKANKYLREYGWESIFYDQYECKCSVSNPPIDLMEWSQTKAEEDATASSPFFTLSNDQWWYLFRERDRAEHLFAHATISFGDWEAKGLIIMPDNWQKPDGIPLTTDYDWGFRWDKSKNKYVKEGIDGYAKNLLTPNNWERLEYAGAVFLPAAGSNGTSKYISGCYWTSTSFGDDTHARSIKFGKDHLDLDGLYESISNQTNVFSIRNVRVLD